ncbi:MAG: class I SAM-dependent methyltransferase [Chitinophagaceae bacterium]|nr:class I SAM-dependent methyltransferase [Chitinophagaceae bacterium]
MGTKRYIFEEVEKCEMCGDPTARHKVLGQRLNTSQGAKPKRKAGISVSVKKCRNCKLIYSSPMPVPGDISDHYGIPPESYWYPEYFKVDPGYFSSQINVIKKLMDIKPGMKSLDVGAGLGKCMIALANAGFDTYGFEPSKPFYERAISKMNIPEEKLKLGMIEEMDYAPESFDLITMGAVVEHLYHPAYCIEKAFKWLKPGGLIFIEVPSSKYLMQRLVNIYYRLTGTNYVSNISPMHQPFHLYEFSLTSFEKLSERINYRIVHHQYHPAEIMYPPKFLRGLYKKLMKWTDTGMQLEVWLKK